MCVSVRSGALAPGPPGLGLYVSHFSKSLYEGLMLTILPPAAASNRSVLDSQAKALLSGARPAALQLV